MALQKVPLLMEKMVSLITEKLQANFAPMCLDPDHTYTDGIDVTAPPANAYFLSLKKQTLKLPACYVIAGPSEINYEGDPNYFVSRDELIVLVASEHEDAEKLQKKCWRYQRLIIGILNNVEITDGSADRIGAKLIARRLGTTDSTTVALDGGQKRFRQDAVVEFDIYHYEKNLI